MSSRDKILHAVRNARLSQTSGSAPEIPDFNPPFDGAPEKFAEVLESIGGTFFRVNGPEEVVSVLKKRFPDAGRIVSPWPDMHGFAQAVAVGADPQLLENVDLAILEAEFAVAENGAVWITEAAMGERILPFICQHLAVVVSEKDLLSTMHEAYARIGAQEYGFGVFIAGPSKTADIEQSLVLGAHGARSMTVLIIKPPF